MMSEFDTGEPTPPPELFRNVIDDRFMEGTPRRHRPGMGYGEEELFLTGDPTAIGLPDVPATVYLVRPKPHDVSRIKPRGASEPQGYQLYVHQLLPATDGTPELKTETVYFIPTQGEGDQIWQRFSYHDARSAAPPPEKTSLLGERVIQWASLSRSCRPEYEGTNRAPIDDSDHVGRILQFIRTSPLAEPPER